ncbi:MAG: phospho-N-acetylmuramoyl-pentapeptide-transferase [Planctomycetes bacterium]|nr:phospho-N-acetylmuramoyl-pentapeptide-transferase [Planctomycetota bacterium]
MLVGAFVIKKLKKFHVAEDTSKTDSEELKRLHEGKKNTPTMGGIIIMIGIVGSTFLWCNLRNGYVLLSLFAILCFGIIGFFDDYIKLTQKHAAGLTWRTKLMSQFALSFVLALILYFCFGGIEGFTSLAIPFFTQLKVNLGPLYLVAITIFIAASSNAVNLTDGLDGLAIGCTIITATTLACVTYIVGHASVGAYCNTPLHILHIPECTELSIFCSALIGAGLGFLWYNCFPAQVFMGNTGSLSIGGVLGFIAAVSKQELLLLLIGSIFFIELFSVLIQFTYFKLSGGKRVFRCAPIHHHFQFMGWSETKITNRFFILAAVIAAFGFAGFTSG